MNLFNKITIRRTNSYSARLPIDDSASPGACSDMSESETPSFQFIDFDSLDNFATTLESSRNYVCAQTTHALEAELRRLKLELKQTLEAYNSACREAVIAKQRAADIQQVKTEKVRKFEEARIAEESAIALPEVERQKTEVAIEAAQRLADMEAQRRKIAEKRAKQEEEEKKRALMGKKQNSVGFHYRRYSIQDIEVATNYYDDSYKIGEGGYGPVFRGTLDHTPVAIKVLRPNISQLHKQFKQEVHPCGY